MEVLAALPVATLGDIDAVVAVVAADNALVAASSAVLGLQFRVKL